MKVSNFWTDRSYSWIGQTTVSEHHFHEMVLPGAMGDTRATVSISHRHEGGSRSHSHVAEWGDLLARVEAQS